MLAQLAAIFDPETTPQNEPRSGHFETSRMLRPMPTSLLLLAAFTLSGCAGDTNPIRDAAVAAGVTGGEPRPAPDFVARTRPAQVDYLPIGQSAPSRRYRAKDKEEVESAEAQMNRISRVNEARAAAARRAGSQ
jgi:hypothetical protein